jgi:hypothetical protein
MAYYRGCGNHLVESTFRVTARVTERRTYTISTWSEEEARRIVTEDYVEPITTDDVQVEVDAVEEI